MTWCNRVLVTIEETDKLPCNLELVILYCYQCLHKNQTETDETAPCQKTQEYVRLFIKSSSSQEIHLGVVQVYSIPSCIPHQNLN